MDRVVNRILSPLHRGWILVALAPCFAWVGCASPNRWANQQTGAPSTETATEPASKTALVSFRQDTTTDAKTETLQPPMQLPVPENQERAEQTDESGKTDVNSGSTDAEAQTEFAELIEGQDALEITGMLPGPNDQTGGDTLDVQAVIDSIHETFPLLFAAYQENQIAAGERLSASGAFDTKFKATSESKMLGFYETNRNSVGVTRPLFSGGDLFAGYKLGRGFFEPWFEERQSNDGGELSAGFIIPLMRDRSIDERRAELWRRGFDLQRAQPEIRAQLIFFIRDGTVAYWKWVSAGLKVRIAERALELARERNDQIKQQVDAEILDPPVLTDNLRSIASREAKLVALKRSLAEAAIKLSLFYRTIEGEPLLPQASQLGEFPEPSEFDPLALEFDIQTAISQRPELAALDALAQSVRIDIAEASNNLLPSIDATLTGSQDMGEPTSSKRDKSRFELEAGLFVDVPVQLRKARGKLQSSRGKLAQILEKRRFTVDKVRSDVQAAYAAIEAALKRLETARESRRLANELARIEQQKFDAESAGLLTVVLREQFAIEAAELEVETLLEYYTAIADYNAAMARDGR